MDIALVGAGLMGHGIASNLIDAGHRLTVIAHRNRQPVDDLVSRGAVEAGSLEELAQAAEIIVICVSNSQVVERVISGLKPGLKAGSVILDMGTSEPASNRALAEDLAGLGVDFAEAPLAGGPEQAAAGELGAMVGAADEVFDRIEPILHNCCSAVSHFGPVGSGQTAKLINNYLVCGMIALIADSYTVARHAGIDWQRLFDVMQCGSNNSGALRKMVAPAIHGDYDGYKFSLANARKDMGYYVACADELDMTTHLAREVLSVFRKEEDLGRADLLVSRLLDPDR